MCNLSDFDEKGMIMPVPTRLQNIQASFFLIKASCLHIFILEKGLTVKWRILKYISSKMEMCTKLKHLLLIPLKSRLFKIFLRKLPFSKLFILFTYNFNLYLVLHETWFGMIFSFKIPNFQWTKIMQTACTKKSQHLHYFLSTSFFISFNFSQLRMADLPASWTPLHAAKVH